MRQKEEKTRGTAEPIPLLTTGKVFENGSAIEPLRDPTNPGGMCLLYWDGRQAVIASEAKCNGQRYKPAPIDSTILRALTLPMGIATSGSSRKLLEDMSSIITEYTGLPENSISAMSRWVLSTWFPEVRPAPGLSLIGPGAPFSRQQFALLSCFCRHALVLTEVTAANLRALPSEWDLTFLIHQRELSAEVERLLSIGRRSVGFIPRGGHLLDFHCAVATYTELGGSRGSGVLPSLEISVLADRQGLPVLQNSVRQKIAADFQPRLLGYRLEKFSKVLDSTFDAPGLVPSMRELAKNLGACTPDDPDLQAQVPGFLRLQDREVRSAAWLDLNVVIVEAILAFVHEAKENCVFVGEIASAAEAILSGRGENRKVEPREVGPRLGLLDLITEERNAKGIRLVLTGDVSRRVHLLARDFSVPSIQNGAKRCPLCEKVPPKGYV